MLLIFNPSISFNAYFYYYSYQYQRLEERQAQLHQRGFRSSVEKPLVSSVDWILFVCVITVVAFTVT